MKKHLISLVFCFGCASLIAGGDKEIAQKKDALLEKTLEFLIYEKQVRSHEAETINTTAIDAKDTIATSRKEAEEAREVLIQALISLLEQPQLTQK